MKISRILFALAFVAVTCSVALADSTATDPKVFTQGCGGKGQPACDFYALTPDNPTTLSNVVLTFLAASDPSNPYGVVAAFADVVNFSGVSIGSLLLNLDPTDSSGEPLSYTCGSAPEGSTGSFSCNQLGPDSFSFQGGPICSVPSGSVPEYQFLLNPSCQYGERLVLVATDGDPSNLVGQTVGATIFAPEPATALLLLFGLIGTGVGKLRKNHAA